MHNETQRHVLHWSEYGCELLGTAILVFVGLSAVVFDFAPQLPMSRLLPGQGVRLLLTGLIFSGSGSLVAISPIGKLSGAHINPCVTLAFWLRKKMHWRDALLYMVFQFVGGFLGACFLSVVWAPYVRSINFGMTMPGKGFPLGIVFFAEVGCTFALVLGILLFVSSHRLMKWTPLMNWILVATMVWQEAPISGTSLNPARSAGPAAVAHDWTLQWLYFIAPPLGGAIAALSFPIFEKSGREILTGKIFHSRHYPSLFKNVPHPADAEKRA